MQFLIEQLDPSAGEVLHRAVVTGRSGVLHAATELAENDSGAAAELEALTRSPEGELVGSFGVFRFAPAG